MSVLSIDGNRCIIHNIGEYEVYMDGNNLVFEKPTEEIKNAIQIVEKQISSKTIYDCNKLIKNKKILKFSKIIYFSINNTICESVKYWNGIIIHLYEMINDAKLILKNTILKIVECKTNDYHFTYNEKLGISIQGSVIAKMIEEIYIMSKICEIKIKIKIELNDKSIIYLKDDFRSF